MIERLFSPEMIYALGWTLIHALWQGAVFACLLAVVLILLRRYSAQARYVVAVGLLCGFVVTTVITFAHLHERSPVMALEYARAESVTSDGQATDIAANVAAEKPAATPQSLPAEGISPPSFADRMVNYYNRNLPLIVTCWLLGVLVLLLRLLGQMAYVQRLKFYGIAQFPESWQNRLRELEVNLNLRRPIRYLLSYRIDSPFTFGWMRPVILFPAALIKILEDTQIYSILAHELAHVKRDDFLVNLLQQLLLTLFFYHPGLWWMAARIDEEREHSCDDLAVRITKQPIGYAKTLLQLIETQMSNSSLTVNFQGVGPANRKDFKARITRLLSPPLAKASYGEGITTALILVLTLAIAVRAGAYPPNTSGELNNTFTTTNEEDPATALIKTDFELFLEAIDDGNMRLVTHFLELGVDVNGLSNNGSTPLMVAASEDRPEIARLLIDKGAKVNFVNPDGWTALTKAAAEGAYATAVVLLDAGADAHLKTGDEVSPLIMAASEGHPDILQLLLERGAKLPAATSGQLPLHVAAREGQLDVIQALLKLGVAIDQQDEEGRTPLSYAAAERQTEVVSFLLGRGADVGLLDNNGHSALDFAAREDAGEAMKLLLASKAGAKLLQGNNSMLMEASSEGAMSVVRLLVEAGVDVNGTDENGTTPLMFAAREGQDEVITYLLAKGVNVNAASPTEGWTPLLLAARENQAQSLRLLLSKGAKMDVRCNYKSMSYYGKRDQPVTVSYYQGATPLMVAVEDESTEAVKVLLEHRVDVNASIAKRKLELPATYSWEAADAVDPTDTNANVKSIYDTQGWTALMEAVENENEALVKLLLAAGANASAKTSTGITALSIAQKAGKAAIVKLLQQ